MTVHALKDSINAGNKLHSLQATKDGNAERLYQKIGFKTDHTISYYVEEL